MAEMNAESLKTEELCAEITKHGAVTFYTKRGMASWYREVAQLVDEGFAVANDCSIDSQSSCVIVRKK